MKPSKLIRQIIGAARGMELPLVNKNAYLILAHSDPAHLAKLVDALRENSDVYIHLDAKIDITLFDDVRARGNVFFVAHRHSVAWAGISMVDAILELMSEAMKAPVRYGHVAILTGSDFPLRHVSQINQIFNDNPKLEFIKYSDVRETPHYLKLVTRRYYREPFFRSRFYIIRLIDRVLRKAISSLGFKDHWDFRVVPYRGHTWCALTGACCEYILKFHRENPWFYKMNIHSFAPDEHYFHTIVAQSPFAANSLGLQRCIGGLFPMATTHLIDMSLTKWFTIADWQTVIDSDKLFIRKVRSVDGSSLVEKITRELHKPPDGQAAG